ncbi:ABC transporter permease [Chondrinema litorale]|uniref:ABC transporter permease n=1 Tax=Chondrinema litorale TaxID=2994555 RepID=UPI002542FBF6|nr:FtsX-like permease family protein [Chondrinema litorale]UZR96431.1 ABC transporter permease [Chondrinema litorale]
MKKSPDNLPPKWPLGILKFFLKDEYLEEIEGDMEEIFQENVEQFSVKRARRMYTWEMLKLLRPTLLKNSNIFSSSNNVAMFSNYYKISIRNLLKHPLNSFINIVGLSVAIGICLVVYAFIEYAYGIDNFHQNKEKVFLATSLINRENVNEQYGTSPRPLGEILKADFEQVNKFCRVEDQQVVLKYEDHVFQEQVRFTDAAFLEMLTFPLKWGSPQSLNDASGIVLSSDMAIKYFGETNPIGQDLSMIFNNGENKAFKVAGVAEAFPKTHAIHFDFLVNFENLKLSSPNYDFHDWRNFISATLIEVDNPSDILSIENTIQKYVKLQNEAEKDWPVSSFEFVALANLYKNSGAIKNDISMNPPLEAQIALPLIGLFMLLLACFNYINIAIVSATKRLREIGVRKVMGASRNKVIIQFLTENLILTFAASLFGLILALTVFIPWFVQLTSRPLEISLVDEKLWIFIIGMILFTGLVSGLYPSIYISQFGIIKILKNSIQFGKKNTVTKLFLGIQMILACILITGAVMFSQNSSFLYKKKWGYNPDNVVYMKVPDYTAYERMADVLNQKAKVLSISGSKHHLGKTQDIKVLHLTDFEYEVNHLAVEANYFNTLGLQLEEGRFFRENSENDKKAIIVNELLVKNLGLEQPLGKLYEIDNIKYEIIGVLKDFHNKNFYYEIQPTIFTVAKKEEYTYLSVKVNKREQEHIYEVMQANWSNLFPELPFTGGYQEDVWGTFFNDLEIQNKFTRSIAFVAILLAGLGLYGLVTLNISGRVKEFSIRKILGADFTNIVVSITKEYWLLSSIAMLIGGPISYFLIKKLIVYMYAYPIPLGFTGIILSISILMFILLAVVSTQIRKVVISNPVKGLKGD